MNAIEHLHAHGQSIWYDNIERHLLENGILAQLIRDGDIRGVTSNPSIFNNAIARSSDYDSALKPMAWSGWDPEKVFWQLAVEDIRAAADLFLRLYEQTKGSDGFVSLEVDPRLSHDPKRALSEAKRLWELVNRPNLMIKIPATPEGITAIRETIAAGINVNVTLIFSIDRYHAVMNAYLEGLETRLEHGLPIDGIASVASFFVSRLDSKIDTWLQTMIDESGSRAITAKSLLGKTAIANSRLAYAAFEEVFGSDRFNRLKANGARLQRPLWASTSTKNPSYRDTMYVDSLIAPNTVNTIPPQTLDAFRAHGRGDAVMNRNYESDQRTIEDLEGLGISLAKATSELETEGVDAFSTAFTALLETIARRIDNSIEELGTLVDPVKETVDDLEKSLVVRRMFNAEPDLWVDDPEGQAEIRNRLGWLKAPHRGLNYILEYTDFARHCIQKGFTHTLLLGMGGSSLAPEVMRLILGVGSIDGKQGMDLAILDSTHPDQVRSAAMRSPIDRTLYIVSSKSGTTSEVNALMEYFWQRASQRLGDRAAEHFIAITDPGSSLDTVAHQRGFLRIFHADPQVGGRYSALTSFGLAPAALAGIDLEKLLRTAISMAEQCGPDVPYGRNPGLVLGALIGSAANKGRDKLVIFADPLFQYFASWLEQLVAESSGKQGMGIVPVDDGYLLTENDNLNDRLYVYIRHRGEKDTQAEILRKAGCTVIEQQVTNPYQLGALFYQWEIAVPVASALLKVNPFDQPDVQDNKTRTARMVKKFQENGVFDEGECLRQVQDVQFFGQPFPGLDTITVLPEALGLFLDQAHESDYIAINTYLPRNRNTIAHLQRLRTAIRKRTGRVVTLGFGPRFLHSTGQLHKGGANNGLFIELTAQPARDLPIPGFGMTFGNLLHAQALGDLEALLFRNRRAIRLHFLDTQLEDLI